MFSKIVIHRVGNKINQEGLFLSSQELELDEEMKEELLAFFLDSFKAEEQFQFYSESYLTNNAVFSSVSEIFEDKDKFLWESENIAKHLYEVAENPRVQGGDLFVVYFEGEETEQGKIDSIGIFKMEKKMPFLKISADEEDNYSLYKDFGIGFSKLDKGAIIYNQNKELGYVISAFDNNKNGDLYYWFEDFLKIRQREDDYFHTQETLSVYKDYITNKLPEEFEVSRADQADFLNKSLNFFKEREEFKFEDFAQEVLEDKNVIDSFVNYKTDYEQNTQMSIAEDFTINPVAVKKQQRHFKSVIKLDKNFHIYVHGDRKMIETGQDEKGKFYRLYFEKEQ